MNKKARLVLRILAVITGLEALGGAAFLGLDVVISYSLSRTPRVGDGHLPNIFFYYVFVNILFASMLAFSAVLLWKLRKTGIALLSATVACEVVYFLAPVPILTASSDSAQQVGAFLGVGNVGIGLQLVTAFPLVAFILIALCFRYLRADESHSYERKPSAITTLLFRTLAAVTCVQILYGLYDMSRLIHFYTGWRQRFAISYPHFPSLLVAIVFVNAALAALLAASAVSLWKIKRKSLLRISWIFGFEIFYLALTVIWSMRLAAHWGEHQVRWFGIVAYPPLGMPMVWSQSHTYYLLVAPAIVIAAYISHGLAGRNFNSSATIPIPAAK
jgi:hypothetical protein